MKKIYTLLNYSIKIVCLIIFILLVNMEIDSSTATVFNNSSNRITDLSLMALRLEEEQKNDIYSPLAVYSGDLTGYGANCPLCNGTLSCMPSYYVKDGTDSYVDASYGKVRIVASSKNMPCGSIVRFNSKLAEEPIIAIVLDRGVTGYDLDLLAPSEDYASRYIGRSTITYEVLRNGWTR